MSHRFPPLRPPAHTARPLAPRARAEPGITAADLCLTAALVLSLMFALI